MKYILILLLLSACSSGSNSSSPSPVLSVKLVSPAINIEGMDNNYSFQITNSGGDFSGSFLINQTPKSCGLIKTNSSCNLIFTTTEKINSIEVNQENFNLVSFSTQEFEEIKNIIQVFKEGDFYQENTNFDLMLNLSVLNILEDSNLTNKFKDLENVNWSPTINSAQKLPFYFFSFFNLQNQDLNDPVEVYLRIWDLNEIILDNGVMNEDVFISKLYETKFLISTLIKNEQFSSLNSLANVFYLHYLSSFSQKNYLFNNSLRLGSYNYSFDDYNSCRSLRYKIDIFNSLKNHLPTESLLEVEFLRLLLSEESCPISQLEEAFSYSNLTKVKEILTIRPFSGSLRDLIDFIQFIKNP